MSQKHKRKIWRYSIKIFLIKFIIQTPHFNYLSWNTCNYCIIRDIRNNHCICSYNHKIINYYISNNFCSWIYNNIIPYSRILASILSNSNILINNTIITNLNIWTNYNILRMGKLYRISYLTGITYYYIILYLLYSIFRKKAFLIFVNIPFFRHNFINTLMQNSALSADTYKRCKLFLFISFIPLKITR